LDSAEIDKIRGKGSSGGIVIFAEYERVII